MLSADVHVHIASQQILYLRDRFFFFQLQFQLFDPRCELLKRFIHVHSIKPSPSAKVVFTSLKA